MSFRAAIAKGDKSCAVQRITVTPEWEIATGLPAFTTGSVVWARAVATSSGSGRAVIQTTMTTTDAIRDSTTILRWVVWSAVLIDALLMALLRLLRRPGQPTG